MNGKVHTFTEKDGSAKEICTGIDRKYCCLKSLAGSVFGRLSRAGQVLRLNQLKSIACREADLSLMFEVSLLVPYLSRGVNDISLACILQRFNHVRRTNIKIFSHETKDKTTIVTNSELYCAIKGKASQCVRSLFLRLVNFFTLGLRRNILQTQ